MHKTSVRWMAAVALVATVTALVLVGNARSQVNASPSWVPIGVSASGSTSTAWFHEPASRQVVACRAVEGQGGRQAAVQCVAGGLP